MAANTDTIEGGLARALESAVGRGRTLASLNLSALYVAEVPGDILHVALLRTGVEDLAPQRARLLKVHCPRGKQPPRLQEKNE